MGWSETNYYITDMSHDNIVIEASQDYSEFGNQGNKDVIVIDLNQIVDGHTPLGKIMHMPTQYSVEKITWQEFLDERRKKIVGPGIRLPDDRVLVNLHTDYCGDISFCLYIFSQKKEVIKIDF